MQIFVPILEGNLSVENALKLSPKCFQEKTCKIKQMQNIPVTLRAFLNQLKMFFKKLNPKEDSSNTTTTKVLGKISNRKKTPRQLAFTCSKLTIEQLEQGMKYV